MKCACAAAVFSRLLGGLLSLVLFCLPGLGVQARRLPNTIPVTTTIQAAINAAQEGDTISIPAGTYTEALTIDKSLTLVTLPGLGGNWATIRPDNGTHRIITVQSGHNLTLKDLILTGGFSSGAGSNAGGAVLIQNGTLTIDHCEIHANLGYYGGAVFHEGSGQVIVQNSSSIHANIASIDGGGIYAGGSLSMVNSNMEYNEAGRHGGGASVMGSLFNAEGSRFAHNEAAENGGAVNLNNSATIFQSQFVENSAGTNGGGVLQWNGDDGLSVVIQQTTFDGNTAGATGGALSVYNGAATTISYSQFLNNLVDTQNSAIPHGGGVYFSDSVWGHSLTIQNSTFTGNTLECVSCATQYGGGVYAKVKTPGISLLTGNRFLNNDAWMGGGVNANGAVIDHTTFQGNTGGYGGGAYLWGNSQILGSAFLQNTVVNSGGGLLVSSSAASVTLEDTKFVGNSGGSDLGAAMRLDGDSVTLRNVAVADTQVGSGGAVQFSNAVSTIQLTHVTVNDTHLSNGSRSGTYGIHIKSAQSVEIWNSLITNHGTGVQIDSASTSCSLDHTLWFGNAWNIAGAGSCANNSAVSGDPAYAVDRVHLTAASAAINHGIFRGVLFDIDGDDRDSTPDIGADEYRARVFLPFLRR